MYPQFDNPCDQGAVCQMIICSLLSLIQHFHPCTGLIFVSLGAMRGLWLSLAHTYLPFSFEAWLTGRQPWHSCRRCGACYYAYINILINTWSAIEEIITCHHSTALCCACACNVYARAPMNLHVSSHKYDLCSSRSSSSINEFSTPLIWKAACWSSSCTASFGTHAKT